MPHASLVAFQVFTAILAMFFFIWFVVMEWLVVRCVLAGEIDESNSSFSKYVLAKEYNLSVGLKFIFSLLCTSIARASLGVFMCVTVNGVGYLKEDLSIVCVGSDGQYSGLGFFASVGLLQVFVFPFVVNAVLYRALFKGGGG